MEQVAELEHDGPKKASDHPDNLRPILADGAANKAASEWTVQAHPIASIFPLMSEEELAALVEDIRQHGLREPITIYEGKVLDGRNRLEACRRLGIVPQTRLFTGSPLEAIAFVWSQNRVRRHLTSSQAAIAEAKRLKFCREYAAEVEKIKEHARRRQIEGGKTAGKGRPQKVVETIPQAIAEETRKREERKTRTARARLAGTNPRYVPLADRVLEQAPDLAEKVERGELTLPQARTELARREKRKELAEKARQVKRSGAKSWQIVCGDCLEILPQLTDKARLVFADPPYNIGVDYGEGPEADSLPDEQYMAWVERWLAACRDALTPDGSLWVLICDEYAAEYAITLKRLGLTIRSWIKWYESFGVNCHRNFNRCSRHLFYCVRDPKQFVFNEDAVTRPSDRQLKYQDRRAQPNGKLWDNIWGINPPIPRLTGTSRERLPDFPTQLPVALLEPIVLCASDPGDLVIDPFSGSGTTGVAAVRHGRRYLGIERSETFARLSSLRLEGESHD